MTAKLTRELRQALEKSPEQPLTVEDPDTHTQYVLIRMEAYQNLQHPSEARLLAIDRVPASQATKKGILPVWCNVLDDLAENEIEAIEGIALRRADLTRSS